MHTISLGFNGVPLAALNFLIPSIFNSRDVTLHTLTLSVILRCFRSETIIHESLSLWKIPRSFVCLKSQLTISYLSGTILS